eukprot:TRINITY_DN62994_c0_g1_i1.p1 TRINITY_DN62994_c0_g1~~TRINITY_DN62994_c0_g1_i1.p1  ORF type:complete len:206 (+),score=13.25 TRINITY_DN62994_c0_g1_i1:360-977(+)
MMPSRAVASQGFMGVAGLPFGANNVYQTLGFAGETHPDQLEFVTFGKFTFRPTNGEEAFAYGIDMTIGKLADRWWLGSMECKGNAEDPTGGFICGSSNWIQLGFWQTKNPSVLRVELLHLAPTSTTTTTTSTSVTSATTTTATTATTSTSTTSVDPCAAACKAVNDGRSCRPSPAPCPPPARCVAGPRFTYYCTVQGTSCQGKCG